MGSLTGENNRSLFVSIAVFLFAILALALRMVPALFIPNHGAILTTDPDTWYTLRQIEVMVAHFPQYNWFDPMTAFPQGKTIEWGPLYPFIAAICCLTLGVSSRPDIMYIAGWLSPLLAAVMVPIAYTLGKQLWDWKAGLFSAGLISVFSYQYFVESAYGFVDHHTAEIVFTSLFVLAYLYVLDTTKKAPLDPGNLKTLGIQIVLSCAAGVLFFLGYITSPTALLILLVVAITTCVLYILDYRVGQCPRYLLFTNTTTFLSVAILIALFGFHNDGMSMTAYTTGPVLVVLGLIAESMILYGLSQVFSKNRMHYLISLLGTICGCCLLILVAPVLHTVRGQIIGLIWNYSAYSSSVVEMQPWTLATAYESFGLTLILIIGGLIILAWYSIRKRQTTHLFLLVWFITLIGMTVPHQRFQLYLTVPSALLSGIFISESLRWSEGAPSLISWFSKKPGQGSTREESDDANNVENAPTRDANNSSVQRTTSFRSIIILEISILVFLVFAGSILQDSIYVTSTPTNELTKDWIDTLGWLKTSTPSPMVDYFQKYDRQTFTYSNASYGIMAPWAAGHEITFLSRRLPITNPFQDNLAGPDGAAAFYLSQNESSANAILTRLRGQYVITDLQMATDNFPSLAPWTDHSLANLPYFVWFISQDAAHPAELIETYRLADPYFQSQIVRLQIFDGSMVLSGTGQYIQYTIQKVPGSGEPNGAGEEVRVITGIREINSSRDSVRITPEGSEGQVPGASSYADVFSATPYQPVNKVPALTHYRLVHESPTNISTLLNWTPGTAALPDIRSVKIFEYVKGARIPGEGVIEITVITNTGRSFIYRQESAGGAFVVPYATGESTTGVRTAGPYHIVRTDQYIQVTENDVLNGATVTGSAISA